MCCQAQYCSPAAIAGIEEDLKTNRSGCRQAGGEGVVLGASSAQLKQGADAVRAGNRESFQCGEIAGACCAKGKCSTTKARTSSDAPSYILSPVGADGRWRAANAKLGQTGATKPDMGALNPRWL